MTKKTIGTIALSALALSLLSGCASIQDQIAKKVAEGVVSQATGGKVNINEKNGTVSFKDEKGNEAQVGGGDQRPASVPADMPSLPGAAGFGWLGSKDGGMLTFTMKSATYKDVCTQEKALMLANGWVESKNGFNAEFENTLSVAYEKTGYNMTLSCSQDSGEQTTTVSLVKVYSDAGNQPTTPSQQ